MVGGHPQSLAGTSPCTLFVVSVRSPDLTCWLAESLFDNMGIVFFNPLPPNLEARKSAEGLSPSARPDGCHILQATPAPSWMARLINPNPLQSPMA